MAIISLVGRLSHNVWIEIVQAILSNILSSIVLYIKFQFSRAKFQDIQPLGKSICILSSSFLNTLLLISYIISASLLLSLYLTSLTIIYHPLYSFSNIDFNSSSLFHVKSSTLSQTSILILFLSDSCCMKFALSLLSSSWIYNHFLKSKKPTLAFSSMFLPVIVFIVVVNTSHVLGSCLALLNNAIIFSAAHHLSQKKYFVAIHIIASSVNSHILTSLIIFLSQVISYIICIISDGAILTHHISISDGISLVMSNCFTKFLKSLYILVQLVCLTSSHSFLALRIAISLSITEENVAHCSVNFIVLVMDFTFL